MRTWDPKGWTVIRATLVKINFNARYGRLPDPRPPAKRGRQRTLTKLRPSSKSIRKTGGKQLLDNVFRLRMASAYRICGGSTPHART